ncbi:MAG: tRNA glutamyl-Q(34) synthetase GluQRS [Amylibacter sp.]|nr:tRNA glutamyl-Q(34) synthetase GluQRS [Amylibacter sp.]
MTIERFAPSPTGLLHLGHAYSALLAWDASGRFLLRIEDIDRPRCKPEFEQAIYDDLAWLGLSWPTPVMRQSDRQPAYNAALKKLINLDLCYPCNCTRKDITQAMSAPQEDVTYGPDGPIYPGTCQGRSMDEHTETDAIRLNMRKAIAEISRTLIYDEIGGKTPETIQISPEKLLSKVGDIVLARKDIGTSYHLSVVVDDADQGITHVTRGRDLISATPVHRLLQELLGLPTPIYRHHRLIRDENGKRLAKRYDAMAIRKYRDNGASPQDIREMVGL